MLCVCKCLLELIGQEGIEWIFLVWDVLIYVGFLINLQFVELYFYWYWLNFKYIDLVVVFKQMLDVVWDFLREKLVKELILLLMIVGILNVGKFVFINILFWYVYVLIIVGVILNIFWKIWLNFYLFFMLMGLLIIWNKQCML